MSWDFFTPARAESLPATKVSLDQASGWFAIFQSEGGLQFILLCLAVALAYAIRQAWMNWFKVFFEWLAKKLSVGDVLLAEREKRIVALDLELKRVEHELAAKGIRVAQLEEQITWRDRQLTGVNEDLILEEKQNAQLNNTIRRMRSALISKQTSDEGIKALLISLEEDGVAYPQQRSTDRPQPAVMPSPTPPVTPTS